jgi:hypothetical protein
MSRIIALLVGVTALTVNSIVAEAEDGCGRGSYYEWPTVCADERAHVPATVPARLRAATVSR